MKKFIIKTYLLHFAAAIFSVIIFLWFISFYLDSYTKHLEYIPTPNVLNQKISEASKILEQKKLKYLIIDSVYNPKAKPGVVLSQNPLPLVNVKENRTIYLTISSFLPPGVEMPKLVDLSERQAIMLLKTCDLKVGKIYYEHSYCNGCVVKQLYHNKEIKAGENIRKGSVIDLIVGTKESIPVELQDTINSSSNAFE